MRDKLPFDNTILDSVISTAKEITAVPNDLCFTELKQIIDTEFSTRGKMLRPILVLNSMLLCGQEISDVSIKAAALTELVHVSSLIHDDIVDDAVQRRGRESVQSKYGKDMAVYAGDFILSRIMRTLVEPQMRYVGDIFSETMEKMCIGELGQKASQFNTDTNVDAYIANIYGKTAALFSLSCQIGAVLTDASEEEQNALSEFGKNIGILFQLRDDLIDIVPQLQNEGKSINSDFNNGIYTMPVIIALHSKERDNILELINKENNAQPLYEILKRCGALKYTVAYMKECANVACDVLSAFPQSAAKDFMMLMPEKLLEFEV